MARGERIGIVLAGGGARGAYEAGVLSVLLPELERRGERPTVIVGTSVGAINAAFLAANAQLGAAEAMEAARRRWRSLDWKHVLKPLAGPGTALAGARYAGAVLGLPGLRLDALLDPAPLRSTLAEWIDWEQLHANTASGLVEDLAIVATSALRARSVVFVEGDGVADADASQEIDYAPARIGIDHIRASAAIPLAFPAIHLDDPAEFAGWYFDGGVRLNTPIKPAIDLGVDRIVVIATHSVSPREATNWHTVGARPDFADGLVQLLFATLVDPLINDVRMLGKVNLLIDDGLSRAAREHQAERGRAPQRQIPYMFVAPDARDTIGDLAAEVYAEHHASIRGRLDDPDVAILARLLGGVTESHGELLSYLLFTPEFATELITRGERDARRWLERSWGPDGPWLLEPVDALEA